MSNEQECCSMEHLRGSKVFFIFRLAPLISLPFYITAAIVIAYSRSKMVKAVRKQYIRQIIINFLFIVIVSIIVCPVLIPPIPGYFMTGMLANAGMNVALPLVLMTHSVILMVLSILQLAQHQLHSLSEHRFTEKFCCLVKAIKWLFRICYLMMIVVAIAILPALTLEFELETFRWSNFEYFHNRLTLCSNMFIADPRHWKIFIPYSASLIFGMMCSVTGLISVATCLALIYDSKSHVSKETLLMQRNFTIALIYQAIVYLAFIIVPVGIISALFYADVPLPEHGLYYLLMISSQGAVNNLMHIVPATWKKLRGKKQRLEPARKENVQMWSTTASFIMT